MVAFINWEATRMTIHQPQSSFSTIIEIDKGVPLPPAQVIFRRKYPLNTMAVGDSFFVPGKTANDMKGPLHYARCSCRKFATRRVIESGITGLRIWRIL